MPSLYDHFELRVEVFGPVAAESPFDSGTLWGRIIHALSIGSEAERALAGQWLSEFGVHANPPESPLVPPLVISEGFPCDTAGEPWLPLPLAETLALQQMPEAERKISRKEIKEIKRVPKKIFDRICSGERLDPEELRQLNRASRPEIESALVPHLSMDRLSGTGRDGLLYMTQVSLYHPQRLKKEKRSQGLSGNLPLPEVLFYLKLCQKDGAGARDLLKSALDRICRHGWGHGTARGLGHIRLKSFAPSPAPPEVPDAQGFVSLSHFTPARNDPTEGQWELKTKHPVPAQFVDGRKIKLGEEDNWRVKSFLRLVAGSCLVFRPGETLRESYGRILDDLLHPVDQDNPLPTLFHYALSYPWPLKGSGDRQ